MGPSLEESVTLLPEYSDCENGETNDKLYKGLVAERARDRHSAGYLYALVLIVIIVDLVVYGAIAYDAATEQFVNNKVDHLEIRNSYVGLDELYASGLVNSSHLPSILNLPRVVGQVYQDDSLRLSPQDEHLWLTPYGAMAPPDRHLQVSDNVHTVYQFRTIDFGMERCQLAMRLPELGDTTTGPFVVKGDGDGVAVDVCETDMSRPLDLWHLSWRNRPICREHVGTFVGVPGQEVTLPEFPCKWNELHTYEVSCANTGCILDVWSNQNLTWGIFLYQHQTV